MANGGGEGRLSRRDFLVAGALVALGLSGLRALAERGSRLRRGAVLPGPSSEAAEDLPLPPDAAREEAPIRARVTAACIACGLCWAVCPEVFAMGDGYAEVILAEVPEQARERCRQAARECPAQAIVIEQVS